MPILHDLPTDHPPAIIAIPECDQCGAIDGFAGLYDRDGRWHWFVDLILVYSLGWETMSGFRERFGDDAPEPTRATVVDGRCQTCGEGRG